MSINPPKHTGGRDALSVSVKDVFSRIRSRRTSPSAVVLWVNDPPAEMSSCRADSFLSPNQKCWSNTWSEIDKSGPACVSCENLAQAAPKDSFSSWRKSRISFRREAMWDMGKNVRQNLSRSSSHYPFTFPMLWAYHYLALSLREKGNNFHRSVSCAMPAIDRHEHNCSNSRSWW